MLTIKNWSKSFHGKKIIDAISVDIPRGSVAVFLGSSGVGKSTLLRILSNLEKLDEGSTLLDGQPLDLNTVNRTHTVGMVFQHFNLFDHLSVVENITVPLTKILNLSQQEAHARALQFLKKYGLEDKVTSSVQRLSGGQKQRLALARALAMQPKIICLDEPTSALDPLLTAHVAQSINELAAEGYIVLVATHDTSLLDRLEGTVYLMEHGSIIESATTQELKEQSSAHPRLNAFVQGHPPALYD